MEAYSSEKIGSENFVTDFRLYLQNELVKRCGQNRNYSLRSFARYLAIDASTLSQILKGKRVIGSRLRTKLASRLGLNPSEITSLKLSAGALMASRPVKNIAADSFKVIADWYHYAIFELVTVKNFSSNPVWISKKLGINAVEARAALERLERLNLIKKDTKGIWKQAPFVLTTTGTPSSTGAFRVLQRQVLEQALQALDELPIEVRDQTSMTMAINSKSLSEAKLRIKRFRRELCDYLQKDNDRDSVYQLGISLYPLTKLEKSNTETKK